MSRYIDKDKLVSELKSGNESERLEYMGVFGVIYSMPEADAVEVIRCKDCKFYIDNNCYMSNLKENGSYLGKIHWVSENDYCSYGERKENKE